MFVKELTSCVTDWTAERVSDGPHTLSGWPIRATSRVGPSICHFTRDELCCFITGFDVRMVRLN